MCSKAAAAEGAKEADEQLYIDWVEPQTNAPSQKHKHKHKNKEKQTESNEE